MRFETPIYFQQITPGEYDQTTGDYAPDNTKEVKCYASVTNPGVETLQIVYGELKQGSFTVRLQNHYTKPFDKIRIGKKHYRVDFERKLRTKHVFIVSEVQNNAQN